MRRYFRHILLSLISVICTVSCIKELDDPNPVHVSDTPTVLVPRVKSFTNQYITKAGYTTDETQISSLTVLVFNNNGQLVHIQQPSNLSSIELNKSMLDAPGQEVTAATIVMIANVGLDKITDGNGNTFQEIKANKLALTLEGMENCTFDFSANPVITSISDNFTGFPMIGGVKNVNLSATKESQNTISVPLKILYAKINFSISVANGTENTGTGMKFTLNGYSVHNVANKTGVAIPTEKGEPVSDFLGEIMNEDDKAENDGATDSSDYTESGVTGSKTGTTNVSGQPITFTFYIAESRYNHNSDLKGIYPSDDWLTTDDTQDGQVKNGVKSFYDDLIQQYKPKLASVSTGKPAAGLASYVLLSGTYVDYRGTSWNVNYTVYLGKDNAQNFHVDRNSEYTNYITIKGIRNNDSYIDRDDEGNITSDQHVWIDHRVNVSTTDLSGHVAITRETLVDAHFEVRPLRVNFPDGINRAFLYLPKYDNVQKDETATGTNENWIAIENNNGRVKDITQYSSNGKRKYFTTSLIKQLYLENNDETYGIRTNNISGDPRNGQKYIQLFDGDCAWIYIDENVKGGEREAIIELIFYDEDGDALSDVESFRIKQQGLYTTSSGFKIENYEEYLHTYDSQDLYTNPLTDYTQQGYKWGLEGTNLSKSQNVVLSGDTPSDSYYYDFFHLKDREKSNAIGSLGTYEVVGGNIEDNHGLNFTNNAGISNEMTIIDMNTRPSSAIQYCLSKNKFEVDESADEKHKMDVHWYLPDVYEMTQILNEGESTFSDFGEYTYWSSQPAWKTPQNLSGLNYLVDDEDNARAVSIDAAKADKYTGTTAPRTNQHRIRCAYSVEGISNVDFSGSRAPEGIGAMRFYMRAWKDWATKEKGYFSWLPKGDTDPAETDYSLEDSYDYPMDSGDADQYFGAYLAGYGFEKNPSDENNWKTEIVEGYLGATYTSQVVLYMWPGLTTKQVISNQTVSGNPYYTLGEDKTESKSTTIIDFIGYNNDITTESLKPLGHLLENNDLSIQFIKGSDASKSPVYKYYKENTTTTTTTTRTWVPPTYKENILKEDSKNYSLRTPGGLVQLNLEEQDYYDNTLKDYTLFGYGYKRERLINNDGYIYPDEETARNAGNDATIAINELGDEVEIPSGISRVVNVESQSVPWYNYYEKTGSGLSTKYNMKTKSGTRYRYRIEYTVEGAQTPYYAYESGGEWHEGSPVSGEPKTNNDPPTDQLTMYGGNSFTIKANNDNVISSVKIYFSGNNKGEENEGLLAGEGKDYLRFTKDGFTGTSKQNPPGMTYSGDGDKGTMTWSGDPQSELTFKLVVIRKVYDNLGLWGDPTSFQYIANTTESKEESIIIDQIDVRYKKKSTDASK